MKALSVRLEEVLTTEVDIRKKKRKNKLPLIEIKHRIIEWVAGLLLFLNCLAVLIGLVLIMRSD